MASKTDKLLIFLEWAAALNGGGLPAWNLYPDEHEMMDGWAETGYISLESWDGSRMGPAGGRGPMAQPVTMRVVLSDPAWTAAQAARVKRLEAMGRILPNPPNIDAGAVIALCAGIPEYADLLIDLENCMVDNGGTWEPLKGSAADLEKPEWAARLYLEVDKARRLEGSHLAVVNETGPGQFTVTLCRAAIDAAHYYRKERGQAALEKVRQAKETKALKASGGKHKAARNG